MRRARLIENRAVFLAYVLAKCNFSTIEGLHRRFPLVWQRRDQYKYYKHVCLERPSFKEEYQLKFAYCLFEEAEHDQDIFNVLFDILYKQYPLLYKELKKNYSRHNLLPDMDLEKLMSQKDQSNQDYLIYLSVFDFFIQKLEVKISEGEQYYQLKQRCDKLQHTILEFEEESYQYLKQNLTQPSSISFKQIKNFCRSYSDYLGQSIIDVLNSKLILFNQNKKSQWLHELGLMNQEFSHRLTASDVYQLIALLLCTDEDDSCDEDVEIIKVGDYVLPVPIFEAFEESLNELLPYFVMSQLIKENREFFLQSYTLKDQMISKQLEKEVDLLKRDLKSLKEVNKSLKRTINKQKLVQEKAHKRQLKNLQTMLITTTREKERLQQEIVRLKNKCEQLEFTLKNEDEQQDVNHEIILSEVIDVNKINKAEIMIVGGATQTIQKLKRVLPNCKYFEVDKKYNDQYFNGVKLAILLTNILNHGMTKKLDKHCPQVIKKSVSATNVELIIKEIAKVQLNK